MSVGMLSKLCMPIGLVFVGRQSGINCVRQSYIYYRILPLGWLALRELCGLKDNFAGKFSKRLAGYRKPCSRISETFSVGQNFSRERILGAKVDRELRRSGR